MPGMSIHVVDVSRGIVATGMRVTVLREVEPGSTMVPLVEGRIAADGLLAHTALGARQTAGRYRARFHVAEYYASSGIDLPPVPFLDVVAYDFGIADPAQHYHLPFKCTPWGYSCFRGGA